MNENRTRIALDVSSAYKRTLKSVASLEGEFVSTLILKAVAAQHPALRDVTLKELAKEKRP